MIEKQKEKVAIQQAVRGVMEQHISKWHSVAALKSQYDKFILNLKKIEGHIMVLQQDLAPLKDKRNRLKEQLLDRLFPVISVLDVYASETGNSKLAKFLKGKLKESRDLKPDALIRFAGRVTEKSEQLLETEVIANKKQSALHFKDYGLTSQHLAKLKSAMEAYQSALSEHRDAKLSGKRSLVKLSQKIRENEAILANKIDKMMHLFRENQKAFYNAYIKSRLAPAKGGQAGKAAPEEAGEPSAPADQQPAPEKQPPAAGTKKAEPVKQQPETGAQKAASVKTKGNTK